MLRRLRADARTHRLLVVILTTSREEEDVAAGYDLGANSYIRKPVDFRQFAVAVETVRTLLAGVERAATPAERIAR